MLLLRLATLLAAAALCESSFDLGGMLRTGHGESDGFGSHTMERTFTMYNSLPVGEKELKAKGWTKHTSNGCDPHLGFAWTEDASGPTKRQPLTLYTTAGGQPAGAGVAILGWGEEPLPEPQKKWATEVPVAKFSGDHRVAHVDVAFRNGDIMCSGDKNDDVVGNTLIVNPKGANNSKMSLPLTETEVAAKGWHRGSCFDGMGWHWFLDTSTGGNSLSWKAENLFPVVTMYHEGKINAIFFVSTINQVSIPLFASNEWEPKALSSPEMCANLCDKDCGFSGLTSAGPFSTFHIYFNDHSSVTCESSLHCGYTFPFRGQCCETDVIV